MDVDYIAGDDAIEKLKDTFKRLPHGERGDAADEIIEFAENFKRKYLEPKTFDVTELEQGVPVVASYDGREELYEFGYYNNSGGCVVYIKGERNMQDSYAFKLNQIRVATSKDLNKLYWGH